MLVEDIEGRQADSEAAVPQARWSETHLRIYRCVRVDHFRRVYATVLDAWLACPSATILGERFEHLPVL